MKIRKIVNTNPDAARQYLKPDSRNALLITMSIKLVLSVIFTFMFSLEGYSGFSAVLFYTVMFSLMYDIGSFYQVCLQIAQSIFIGFLLLLLLLLGAYYLFLYGFSFLASIAPASQVGENISMLITALICLIPLIIDVVRLVKFLKAPQKDIR